jgi:hypothetical protein
MKRTLALALSAALLITGIALADPGIDVSYHAGVPKIGIEGNYSMSRYTILRAEREAGPFSAISQYDVLCLGRCFVDDYTAVPGQTYWYRFDIRPSQGSAVSFGPYPVTIAAPYPSLVHARVTPNPSRGSAGVEIYLHGAAADAPLEVEAALFDLTGRRVRLVHRAALARGISMLRWDGRDDRGRALGAGTYFLRVASPLGTSVQRVVRVP